MAKDDRAGEILVGRYRLGRLLGTGAHGRVYLAEDLGRGGARVALKLVEDIVGDVGRNEADEVLRWFRHPSWAEITDDGPIGKHASFQVTRYVPGQSLDHVVGPQPYEIVWQLLEDGARVLGAIHGQGLIHYDVTPGNWILSHPGGRPHFVLTDGGLAHVGAVEGFARGTPQFMAPEVTEDSGHDCRADLYSLGLVAFRLVAGRDPYDGGAGEILGRRRREKAPAASLFREDVPPALDALLADLLSRDPNGRPHDAADLLKRIGAALEREVAPILHAEGIAAAEGGPLVGRGAELERFQASLSTLAQRLPENGRPPTPRPGPQIKDAVLLLKGAPGCGSTRLTEEFAARARREAVPVLLLSGRETSADRRSPLRHLVDGITALRPGAAGEQRPVRLEFEDKPSLGREEQSHAGSRAIEQVVRAVEATARKTPFVLLVEDLPDLPPRAREAMVVLARHLQSKRENSGATGALPVLLVVDLGSEDPEPFLVPDAQQPERPIVELAPLAPEELEELCGQRFPGYRAGSRDRERIARVSEGLPGVLVALLGEACHRGDLHEEAGKWHWNVDRLDEYEIDRGMSPVHAEALRRADPCLMHLLRYLSLVEAALDETVLLKLWAGGADAHLPVSVLLRTVARDGAIFYAPASLAVKAAVRSAIPEAEYRTYVQDLLTALDEQDAADTVLDRAQLHLELNAPTSTIQLLHKNWPRLTSEARAAVQSTIAAVVARHPQTTSTAAERSRLVDLLEYGPSAISAATALASAVGPQPSELRTAERIAEVLRDGRHYAPALDLLLEKIGEGGQAPSVSARIWTLIAALQFDVHREDRAREALVIARQELRKIHRDHRDYHRLMALYLMADAQSHFLNSRPRRALLCLNGAVICATKTRSLSLRVKALNNLGIVYQQRHEYKLAKRCFERSLRLRKHIGDIEGTIKTTINLGRLAQFAGELVKSTSLYQGAASIALRHAQDFALTTALTALARTYDQQLNARLAASTLQRAVQVGRRAGNEIGVALAAWELAPLAMATGRPDLSREMLSTSASAARKRLTHYSRAMHHLVSTIANLHNGAPQRAGIYLKRLWRVRDTLFAESEQVVNALSHILSAVAPHVDHPVVPIGPRPDSRERARALFRASVWLSRAKNCDRPVPPNPISRFVPTRGGRVCAAGRDRRILIEALLAGAGVRQDAEAGSLLRSTERYLAHAGETMLHARLMALQSVCNPGSSPKVSAQQFSRAVDLLCACDSPPGDVRHTLPAEHTLAFKEHLRGLGGPLAPPASRPGPTELHALAHRLLLRHGFAEAPDGRVAFALRRVLEATGRMNAGAGLDELLGSITRYTLEITGAERVSLVLIEREEAMRMRIATSASTFNDEIGVQDISHTVIQRVLAAKTPLLLHDVFDDQELMGRPSITSLSLRSILCVPMLRGDALYGVLYADNSSAAGSFDQVDLEVLSLFSEQVAAGLETHRLVADLQNSMDELKAMQERLVRGERLRTMGELSSGVAHEFNNLLTSILARVQLICMGPLAPELRQDLSMIEKACLDAAQVVRRLQSYTRKQREGGFVQIDVNAVCRDSAEFLRPLWSTRRRHGRPPVRVHVRTSPGLYVDGDPTELREVVTNLLKNSLDALEDGGEVEVRAEIENGLVRLVVADNGPGIPADTLARVFDPFYTTKGERGTGLGLCLSQQIVERHGGAISVESSPGAGTRVSVELPAAGQGAPAPGDAEATAESPRKTRILVIDDDDNVRSPLCSFLKRSGYAVLSASSGADGLALLRESSVDMIISDVRMPEMNGMELCRTVRAMHEALPIVLMSGWANTLDPRRARQAGASAVLEKPFALQQVRDLIESLLQVTR